MPFHATFSKDFEHKKKVLQIISDWEEEQDEFELQSSGSTGTPKSVVLSKRFLAWSAKSSYASLGLSQERILCCLPIAKTGGFMQLIRALVYDCPIHFVNPSSKPQLADNYSFTSLTPQMLSIAIQQKEIHSFTTILVGGAPVSASLKDEINKLVNPGLTIWETYGMTETASHIGLKNLSKGESEFKCLDGVQVSLEDESLKIEIPEFQISILTNDIAQIENSGFHVLGRSDNVINSGGIKIHPELIEDRIKDILAGMRIFRKLFVVGIDDSELGEQAILVLEGEPIKDVRFILEILKRELPAYQSPKNIQFVPKVNFTETGKVIRKLQ